MLFWEENIAKVSKVPGKTQRIQMFGLSIDNKVGAGNAKRLPKMMLVDLPGYGFAKVKSSLAAGMGITVSDYLSNRNPRISRV